MCVFFFKQKTAYEMRISDWSSDVCSSDLSIRRPRCVPKSAAGPTPTICVATDDNHDFIPIGKRSANHGALPACRQVARGWGGDESPGQEGRKMGAAPPQVGEIGRAHV